LLIDNASKEPLSETVDISWNLQGRHIREDELGLTMARLRGIRESRGKLLVFVDDDNILAPDYLNQAKEISARNPFLGVFGSGMLEPEFEVRPPPELRPYLPLLGLRRVPSALWSNNANDTSCRPWGAGLCVTRRVANACWQLVADLGNAAVLDRRGERLFCGGDDVFSWAAAEVGLGFAVFPELRITHLILARRLNQQYLLRLIRDKAFSNGVLDYLLTGTQQRRIDLVRYVHLLLHGLKNGLSSMRCQFAEAQGKNAAAQFISENRLRPVKTGSVASFD
jgi:glycosyltransferase involved in cell wall biosynthesis